MIVKVSAPIASEASILPVWTSFKLFSIILARNGAEPMESGTTAAVEPIVVPTINLDKGSKITIRIMKGNDLTIFTNVANTLLSLGASSILPFSVTASITPRGKPKASETKVDNTTIYKVSARPVPNS
jgi:hypothetical protein